MKNNTSCYPKWILYNFSFVVVLMLLFPGRSFSQEEKKVIPDGSEGEVFIIPDADSLAGKKKNLQWNEFDLGITTIKFGAGFLYDFATHSQDEVGKVQSDSAGIKLEPTFKARDVRLMISGRLNMKRAISWKAGIIYDGTIDEWLVRETGITLAMPELSSHFFIGRTKEGFSLNKVMNGYAGWTMERQMALDVIPILADGVRWFGYLPKSRVFWNLGAFTDVLSQSQTFSTFSSQYAVRIGWLPIYNEANHTLLHLGASYRYGVPKNGEIRLRSRPESNPSPYFMDTGVFEADHSDHWGGEVYYSRGPLMVGSEFYFHHFKSVEALNPTFFGGDVAVSYMITGESRPYYTQGGNIYGFMPVANPVLKGGWGAWEVVMRVSTLDLTEGNLQGGNFWRITPMVNWYLTSNLRLEFVYGYGVLDRYQLKGATQFFQSRVQFSIN
jgi:phosphate-selective porin OprO and OprP